MATGIRSLEDLRDRCYVDPDTGCWHWRLAITQGAPRVHLVRPDTNERVVMRGRRAALLLMRGHDIPADHFAWARDICKSMDCCNPMHARSGDRVQHGAWLSRTGKVKGLASKALASRRIWDARGRKVTAEIREEILRSNESIAGLARRLSLSKFTVWRIRRGEEYRKVGSAASVFSWRP